MDGDSPESRVREVILVRSQIFTEEGKEPNTVWVEVLVPWIQGREVCIRAEIFRGWIHAVRRI
jgi:hypothetical protein